MPGMSREIFLARITDALKYVEDDPGLPDDLEIARVVRPDQDVLSVFIEKVTQAGMQAHRVADEDALVAKVIELVRDANAKSALIPHEGLPARDRIVAGLEARSISLQDADAPDAGFEADVGITGVSSAVAETGSMFLVSGPQRRRLASLAVPTHIGIVRRDQIVPDLLDWGAGCPADMPAGCVLVSGPSKTADIEMIIIEGVHGPKVEHVIVVG